MKRRIQDHEEGEEVLMSLIISIGMIVLTVVGLWLWDKLPPVSGAPTFF